MLIKSLQYAETFWICPLLNPRHRYSLELEWLSARKHLTASDLPLFLSSPPLSLRKPVLGMFDLWRRWLVEKLGCETRDSSPGLVGGSCGGGSREDWSKCTKRRVSVYVCEWSDFLILSY